ncbi:hypothetical protein KC799_14690 [candidate division KSB1 bacterium]|nr:hypothetical protein [candidate division KSB1 bacterium]
MNRRTILKTSVILPAAIAGTPFANLLGQTSSEKWPDGIIYTKDMPGKWEKKVKSHAPVVSVEGDKITLETVHGMSEEHYIVRHTLVTDKGEVVGEKTFYPVDEEAVSTFKLPADAKVLYATSFCNKHDFWITKVELG